MNKNMLLRIFQSQNITLLQNRSATTGEITLEITLPPNILWNACSLISHAYMRTAA